MFANHAITDKLTVGNSEFAIGHDAKKDEYVTYQRHKGQSDYFWPHQVDCRIAAIEDLCNRCLAEIVCIRKSQQKASKILEEKKSTLVQKNEKYVKDHEGEFNLNKWYVDTENERVTEVYYNPDSNSGGQLVYNQISFNLLREAFSKYIDSEQLLSYLGSCIRQTLCDIDDEDFSGNAKEFVEKTYDFITDDELMATLKSLV